MAPVTQRPPGTSAGSGAARPSDPMPSNDADPTLALIARIRADLDTLEAQLTGQPVQRTGASKGLPTPADAAADAAYGAAWSQDRQEHVRGLCDLLRSAVPCPL